MSTSSNLGGRKIEFLCLNHETPIPFQIQEGTSPFYACPKYFKENREDEEKMCVNRMTIIDAGGIIDKLSRIMDNINPLEEQLNLHNYVFDYKGSKSKFKVKIIEFSTTKVKLGVLNKTALG